MSAQPPSQRVRRDLLLAAINDIQGSVHANDSKSAAVLIVHGLVFGGITAVTTKLGSLFAHAGTAMQVVIASELGMALAFFVASVVALLLAVIPHRPGRKLIERNLSSKPYPPDIFYPQPGSLSAVKCQSETGALLKRLDNLTVRATEAGLAYELVKVQDIQLREARYTRWGVCLLLPELAFVLSYLVTVGIWALAR